MSSLSGALPLRDAWCPGAPDTVKHGSGLRAPRLGSCCGLSQTPALLPRAPGLALPWVCRDSRRSWESLAQARILEGRSTQQGL